jgi:hypothetical protein
LNPADSAQWFVCTATTPATISPIKSRFIDMGDIKSYNKSSGLMEKISMKTIAAAAVLVAFLTIPAYAQSRGRQAPDPQKVDEEKKTKATIDKAYSSAVSRIPEAKQEYDPWADVREKTPATAPPPKKK